MLLYARYIRNDFPDVRWRGSEIMRGNIEKLEGAQRVHISAKCVVGGTHTVEDWTECAQTYTQADRQK